MIGKLLLLFSVVFAAFFLFFKGKIAKNDNLDKIHGLTLVAPPSPFPQNPMPRVQAVNADWIAVVPYAFTRKGSNFVRYNVAGMQWWGERPEGVRETIRLAHKAGIKVMLKPQVYIPGGWTGDLEFEDEQDALAWEADYSKYILYFAEIADSMDVELFCIGTEFRKHIAKRPVFWSTMISEIRNIYHGKLTYSANWDDHQTVPFWDELDYVGISAYFPLVNEKTPKVLALKQAWKPIVKELSDFRAKTNKPILFTEFGYLSVDFCAWKTWELEGKIDQLALNEQAQANALKALLEVFSKEEWWVGGFLWKWFPNGEGHEGYIERDYTPQGKLGEEALRRAYE